MRDAGGTLRIVDFADPARPVVRLTFPEKGRGAAIMPDGRIAIGGGDGFIRFWSQTAVEAEPALAMLGRAIGPLAVSRSGRWLAAGDAAGMIRIRRRLVGRRQLHRAAGERRMRLADRRRRARFLARRDLAGGLDLSGPHCGAGPIFAGRQAYRGADLLAPAAREALIDCAAVRAAFES